MPRPFATAPPPHLPLLLLPCWGMTGGPERPSRGCRPNAPPVLLQTGPVLQAFYRFGPFRVDPERPSRLLPAVRGDAPPLFLLSGGCTGACGCVPQVGAQGRAAVCGAWCGACHAPHQARGN